MQAQGIKWSVEGGYLGSKVSVSVPGVSGSVDFNGFYAGVGADFAMKAVAAELRIARRRHPLLAAQGIAGLSCAKLSA